MNENVKAYRDMKFRELEGWKERLEKELTREARYARHYSSNYIMGLSKNLSVYAVEVARLEGELNVLNQLIGDEPKEE